MMGFGWVGQQLKEYDMKIYVRRVIVNGLGQEGHMILPKNIGGNINGNGFIQKD